MMENNSKFRSDRQTPKTNKDWITKSISEAINAGYHLLFGDRFFGADPGPRTRRAAGYETRSLQAPMDGLTKRPINQAIVENGEAPGGAEMKGSGPLHPSNYLEPANEIPHRQFWPRW